MLAPSPATVTATALRPAGFFRFVGPISLSIVQIIEVKTSENCYINRAVRYPFCTPLNSLDHNGSANGKTSRHMVEAIAEDGPSGCDLSRKEVQCRPEVVFGRQAVRDGFTSRFCGGNDSGLGQGGLLPPKEEPCEGRYGL
jgi:hypothetical protein